MTDYNDGNRHGWDGGERPVHPMTEVEVLFPNGSRKYVTSQDWSPAGDLAWNATPCLFRIVKEYREPREFWVTNNDAFAHDSLEQALADPLTEKHGYIHVREVLE